MTPEEWNMKKTLPPLLAAVLCGLSAVVWTANCVILALSEELSALPGLLLALDVVCAAAWWVAFAASLFRFRRQRELDTGKKQP